jgi:hypothetical protein
MPLIIRRRDISDPKIGPLGRRDSPALSPRPSTRERIEQSETNDPRDPPPSQAAATKRTIARRLARARRGEASVLTLADSNILECGLAGWCYAREGDRAVWSHQNPASSTANSHRQVSTNPHPGVGRPA